MPALVLFIGLVLLPMLFALYAAFFRWGGFGMPSDYVGGDNFTRLFQDDVFLGDLWRCLVLVGLSLVLQLPFALAMAVALNQRLRGRAAYRMLFFAPYVLSEAIIGVLFSMVFAPEDGGAEEPLLVVVPSDDPPSESPPHALSAVMPRPAAAEAARKPRRDSARSPIMR